MSAACCAPQAAQTRTIERKDVAALAHLATSLDYLKNRFKDPMWRDALRRAVHEMHAVATEIDGEHGFGIYAREEGQ
jgi:hypothetical protein